MTLAQKLSSRPSRDADVNQETTGDGGKGVRGRKWRGHTKNTTWFIFVPEVIFLLQTKGLSKKCKARVARRLLVRGAKSNLMTGEKNLIFSSI